jgi:hypothetical protein
MESVILYRRIKKQKQQWLYYEEFKTNTLVISIKSN